MLQVQWVAIDSLKPNPRNARTHSKKQIGQIADAITSFGFLIPLLVDEDRGIIAGHGRLAAAQLLRLDQVPIIEVKGLSDAKRRALALADNKLALNANWDEVILAEELKFLLDSDVDIDVGVTGFSIPEIDLLIEEQKPEDPGDPRDDRLPGRLAGAPTAKRGDIWKLGPHRLVCGDARDGAVVAALMDGEAARMIFSDPPYNVPIVGNVSKSKTANHRDFAMASGEMSKEAFTAFLTATFQNMADVSVDGSIHFLCMDWRHMAEIQAAGQAVYSELKNVIVWAKDNGGMGSFYRSQHELIFAFKNGSKPHVNAFELGQHGRYRTNVWHYKGVNSFKAGRKQELELHPTVKPVQMIADAIKDVSGRGDIVLDVFGGSGSTLIAAHKTGRRAYLCEIDPIYCDRIVARWETYAKDSAELVRSVVEA